MTGGRHRWSARGPTEAPAQDLSGLVSLTNLKELGAQGRKAVRQYVMEDSLRTAGPPAVNEDSFGAARQGGAAPVVETALVRLRTQGGLKKKTGQCGQEGHQEGALDDEGEGGRGRPKLMWRKMSVKLVRVCIAVWSTDPMHIGSTVV